ncbi:non-homologous end-joining DNA ligase [Candidatus Dependentiae bacterium]|nr:non-homologous end-joining DNA ligase [Candidatus Dependentiae bacterium]
MRGITKGQDVLVKYIKVGKYKVRLTNQYFALFTGSSNTFKKIIITKGELIDYYYRIALTMLPHIEDRLLTMHRFPAGIQEKGFFQKDVSDYFPSWIQRKAVKKKTNGIVRYAVCNNAATLVYLANQGCITMHIGLHKIDKMQCPDRMIFDLDPSKKDFAVVKKIAKQLRVLLEDTLGLPTFVMTTGSRGLHVVVPLKRVHTFEYTKQFARSCAEVLVARNMKILTLEMRKNKRKDRIFIDVLRNSFGQTSVAPYSVRAKPGAPIATPLLWQEIGRLKNAQQYHIKNIFRRLSAQSDPWQDIDKKACSLKKAYKKLQKML